MINTLQLVSYIDELLSAHQFQDYCPNGLQVEGKPEIKTLVTGVSANQALLEAAVELNADAILVHHGYFWKGEDPCVTGIRRNRLATLLQHDINLFAYHIPLDAHPRLGNNIQLAELLNIKSTGEFAPMDGQLLARYGELTKAMSGAEFTKLLTEKLGREPLHIKGNDNEIKTIAWCTGAAQNYLEEAVHYEVDAYLTGEVSERTVAQAYEYGIHFYAAGHHATERYGVKALGDHLAKEFNLVHQFIDIPNPV